MRKILAISGGIDSVCLLHKFSKDQQVIVAHFNHGLRDSADADQFFVQKLAAAYSLPFVTKKELLKNNSSEAQLRARRYAFLRSVAQTYQGQIYTAHHQDDLLETIIINFIRGTAWRGLVPLAASDIFRPLLNLTKKDIYRYAAQHQLVFRQDPSNNSDKYLRNRIRQHLSTNSINRKDLLILAEKQRQLKNMIDSTILTSLSPDNSYSRQLFMSLDDNLAIEILRAALLQVKRTATRPQLLNFLQAIRSYANNKKFNLSADYLVTIKKHKFMLE